MVLKEGELSKEHNEIYDRQIRVWGLAAQQRLMQSKILVIGITGIGCEVHTISLLLVIVVHCHYLEVNV